MTHGLVVVGAGVAGLALAGAVRGRGGRPLVLERARGVGGRCATRRLEGQPADHGAAFLHGRGRAFRDALVAMDGPVLADWPRVRVGEGVPCQPEAFDARERRLAPVEGMSRFPKSLATSVDVRLGAEAVRLRPPAEGGEAWTLDLADGGTVAARAVALAMPAPSALALLAGMEPMPAAVAELLPVLELVRMMPSLAVIARYPEGTPRPDWDVAYPETGRVLHAVFHDSAKRPEGAALALVLQARPRFAERQLDEPAEGWTREMLDACARLYGGPYAQPAAVHAHAWRHGRVADGTQLSGPLVARAGAAVLGVAGDGCGTSPGVEGAFLSGIALAGRLIEMSPEILS